MSTHALPFVAPEPSWSWLHRQAGVAAEAQARQWLGQQLGVPAQALPLQRDERGRPRLLAPLLEHDCNWSHSGEGLLVVLGRGLQVGIDLEREHARPRALALAQRYFTAGEVEWLTGQPDADAQARAFLRLWCAKESVLKAHGHGLAFGLDRLRFEEHAGGLRLIECAADLGAPDHWQLRELSPAPGYLGALAWRAATPP